METIKEIKERLARQAEQYVEIEVYYPTSFRCNDPFHTDAIRYTEDYSDDSEVITYKLMDKEDYETSVLANSCISWDDCYNENDKILCILIKEIVD